MENSHAGSSGKTYRERYRALRATTSMKCSEDSAPVPDIPMNFLDLRKTKRPDA